MSTAAQYLVLHVPHWHAGPNHMALVRVYPDAPTTIWFGTASDDDGSSLTYPQNATVVADYGMIANDDTAAQTAAAISAIRSYSPPQVGTRAAEGWIDPAGQFFACHDGDAETHEALARRIGAVRWNRLTDSGTLEWRGWLRLTTSTDLRDVPVSQAQEDTLWDLSQIGVPHGSGLCSACVPPLPTATNNTRWMTTKAAEQKSAQPLCAWPCNRCRRGARWFCTGARWCARVCTGAVGFAPVQTWCR